MRRFFQVVCTIILSFSALLFSNPILAIEDFTEYTEVDSNSRITVTSSRVSWANLGINETGYVYIDKNTDYFSSDFNMNFDLYISDSTASTSVVCSVWGISNLVGTYNTNSADDFLTLLFNSTGATPTRTLQLYEYNGGSATGSSTYVISLDTSYYITISRDEDIGTYGTLYAYIYSDTERTVLLDTLTVALTEKQDFRYLYAFTGRYAGLAGYVSSGYVENLLASGGGYPPLVVTYPEYNYPTGALLMGVYDSYTDLIEAGFNLGISSGNYTTNYTANFSTSSFTCIIPSANLTVGQTYYFRAYATNAGGTGYGEEKSFTWSGEIFSITTDGYNTIRGASGNFSAQMSAIISPIYATSNVSMRLSQNVSFNSTINVELLYTDSGTFVFSTANATYGSEILLPDTTYYYQAYAFYNSYFYWGEVKQFTTGENITFTAPNIAIRSVKDVSNLYNEDYVIEVTGYVQNGGTDLSTNITIDWSVSRGFEFSLAHTGGFLLPPIYHYTVNNIAPDGTFTNIYSFANATWYNGEPLYIRVFAVTAYLGELYSPIMRWDFGVGTSHPTDVTSVPNQFSETVDKTRTSLGMTGTFGTWAFMFLILLIVSLLFGIGFYVTQNTAGKTAIGFAWLMSSISVVGAFLFTGQLGVWPLIVLVLGVVALIIIVVSFRFSGSRGVE